jgi:alpha-L-fucosidase
LIEVVAKGGSLLLGVGPKPDGTMPDEAVKRMEEIGAWMNKNGEAIYNTRVTKNYHEGNTWFTQNNKTGMRYALTYLNEGEAIPVSLSWKTNIPKKGTMVRLLQTGEMVKWSVKDGTVTVKLPKSVVNKISPALAFSFLPSE